MNRNITHEVRSVFEAVLQKWKTTRWKSLYMLALILIAYYFVDQLLRRFLGAASGYLPPLLEVGAVILLTIAAVKRDGREMIYGGLLILPGLLVPTAMVNEFSPDQRWLSLETLEWYIVFLLPSLALVMAALLLYKSYKLYQEWRNRAPGNPPESAAGDSSLAGGQAARVVGRHDGRKAIFGFFLSVALIAKTLNNLYWLIYWDNTVDSIGVLLLILPISAAILVGFALVVILPKWIKVAGVIYPVLTILLIFMACKPAQNLNVRQITIDHAQQVSRLIETYYTREGHYPQSLKELVPRYTLTIPGPVIMYGQGWCYDGGKDYYRLGTVYRQHWSSPYIFGLTYKAKGEIPNLGAICEAEVAAVKKKWQEESRWMGNN